MSYSVTAMEKIAEPCTSLRSESEQKRAPIVAALRQMPQHFANVRLIDPIDLFCDKEVCKPYDGNRVHFNY